MRRHSSAFRRTPEEIIQPDWVLLLTALLLLAGSLLLIMADQSIFVFVVVAFLLVVGVLCGKLFYPGSRDSVLAFVLTYSACVFVAGVSQFSAYEETGSHITTSDCEFFYLASIGPSGDLESLKKFVNAPLAVKVWQTCYAVVRSFGVKQGPWLGVVINSFLVAVSVSLVCSISRFSVFATVARRRKFLIMCPLCGAFWLGGSLFLRESYCMVVISALLWAFCYSLSRDRLRAYSTLATALPVSFWCMLYLRRESVGVIGMLTLTYIAIGIYGAHKSKLRLTIYTTMAVGVVGFFAVVYAFFMESAATAELESARYRIGGAQRAASDSLGVEFITSQPLYVRVVVAPVYLVMFPIPVWGAIYTTRGYLWIKAGNAMFFMAIFPACLSGAYIVVRRFLRHGPPAAADLFVAAFAFGGLYAVALTSTDSRHLLQFMPAFLFLAAIPDLRLPSHRRVYRPTAFYWFSGVVAVYIAWTLMKMS